MRAGFRRWRFSLEVFAAGGFRRWNNKNTKQADTLFAGAVRSRVALFVWRVRELCTRHVVTKLFAAQTWQRVG
jgi:hypothetical protein